MLQFSFKYDLDESVTYDVVGSAVAGTITHCGVDHMGEMYLVQSQDQAGKVFEKWMPVNRLAPIEYN